MEMLDTCHVPKKKVRTKAVMFHWSLRLKRSREKKVGSNLIAKRNEEVRIHRDELEPSNAMKEEHKNANKGVR